MRVWVGIVFVATVHRLFSPELRIILLRSNNNNNNNKNNRTSAYGAASHRRRQHHHTALISSCVLSRTNESRRRPYTPSTRINQSKKCSQKKKVIFLSFSCFSGIYTGWRRLYLYTTQTDRAVWSNRNTNSPRWDLPELGSMDAGEENRPGNPKGKMVQQLRGVVGDSAAVSMTWWWWNQDVCAVAAVANVGMTMISAFFFHLFSHAVNLQRRWGGPAWVAACCCCCGSRPRERYTCAYTRKDFQKKYKWAVETWCSTIFHESGTYELPQRIARHFTQPSHNTSNCIERCIWNNLWNLMTYWSCQWRDLPGSESC